MPKTKKRSSVKQVKPPAKRKNNSVLHPAAQTDVEEIESSSDVRISDSDDARDNEDDDDDAESHLQNVQESLDDVQKLVQDNKKNAKTFESRIEKDTSRVLGAIAQQKHTANTKQDAFTAAFLTATAFALQPLSLNTDSEDTSSNTVGTIKTSTIVTDNDDLFKYSERVCENTVQLLRIYTELAKRGNKSARVPEVQTSLLKDGAIFKDLAIAGTKKAKQQIFERLGDEGQSAHMQTKITPQEQAHARIFEKYGSEGAIMEPESSGLEQFSRKLAETVSKIEELVKN